MGTESPPVARILVVDDEPSICDVLKIALSKDGYHVEAVTDPVKALARFEEVRHDVVIQDIRMPQMDGLELLRRIRAVSPQSVVIVMTAYSTWERAVEAMRSGAYDYIRKPFDTQLDVRATVQRALRVRQFQVGEGAGFDEGLARAGFMVGDSPEMKHVRDLIRRTAPTDSSVFIEGESGVGKELAARALQWLSPRANRPFVPINCGAFPETLLESELFGHVRGAFTGAVTDKVGLLDVADGGTFFLDEISDMSPALQVKLLRVLEEREFKPVGSVQTKRVDVRFLAATNKDLDEEVKHDRFRRDLFYRLNVIRLRIPPLRDRLEDIGLLSGYFLRRYCDRTGKKIKGFTPEAKDGLLRHRWPGNVRELENAIERAVALCDGDEVTVADLFESITSVRTPETSGGAGEARLTEEGIDFERELHEMEGRYLRRALELAGGNYTKAAQLLRLSLRSFRYRLAKHKMLSIEAP